jgi:hypothetical protein
MGHGDSKAAIMMGCIIKSERYEMATKILFYLGELITIRTRIPSSTHGGAGRNYTAIPWNG